MSRRRRGGSLRWTLCTTTNATPSSANAQTTLDFTRTLLCTLPVLAIGTIFALRLGPGMLGRIPASDNSQQDK
jgi:hypothetical protein